MWNTHIVRVTRLRCFVTYDLFRLAQRALFAIVLGGQAFMRLLLINPNTSVAMTDLMLGVARKAASAGVDITGVTGRFGGRYVASRATYAIAAHAALEAYGEYASEAEVVMLSCFGDPGLFALRDIARQPVIGMAEASCLEAAAMGGRFAIVTGGSRWGPMLREFVISIGLGERLAVVETIAPTGADIARAPDDALAALVAACHSAAAVYNPESIILGGAGLAGLAHRIQDRVPIPLIDSVEAMVRAAERLGAGVRDEPLAQRLSIETVGLSPALAKAIYED
jgi:allantoin racemase